MRQVGFGIILWDYSMFEMSDNGFDVGKSCDRAGQWSNKLIGMQT